MRYEEDLALEMEGNGVRCPDPLRLPGVDGRSPIRLLKFVKEDEAEERTLDI